MKNALALAALTAIVTMSAAAQAKTICTVNKRSNMQFGETVFNGEVTGPQMLILTEKGAASFNLSELKTPNHWQDINGKTIVTLGVQQDGIFAMSVTHVDLSKKQNALPMDAMALGYLGDRRSLTLIAPTRGISVNCMELN